jgi:phage/plasmid-like protein (TIGR03299 family)
VEAFQFMDELVSEGQMSYEAAFSMSGGKKVCLLGLMPGVDKIVDGDNQLRYLMMHLCHDGTGAIKFGPTSVRTVCANTTRLAMEQQGTKIRELSIRHSGNMMEKLAEARAIMANAEVRFEEHADSCRDLAQFKMSTDNWLTYLDIVCPTLPKEDPRWTQRRADAIDETRTGIKLAYHDEKQDTAPFTAWAAYNAISQHIDHLPRKGKDSQRKAEARFNVCLYGTGHSQKQFAFETACRIANAG